MRRRAFLAGALSACAVPSVAAQQPARVRRLAIFSPSEPIALMQEGGGRYYRALFEELRRLGYVEGRTLTVERYAREQVTAGPDALAAAVVRSHPDVVYVVGPGALLFKARTATIPIVALTGDPVSAGLVQSLAHPGGNITGVSVDTGPSLHGKRIELLRELSAAMATLGSLALRASWDNLTGAAMREACTAAGIALVSAVLDHPASEADYRDAIANLRRDGADAIMVEATPDTAINRIVITEAIAQAQLPAIYGLREFVDVGGLMAYAFDLVGLNQRVAQVIDAILRGTRPGDIPYFQSSKFELSINLKTARTLGLTVPPSLLARADEVIE